MTEAYVFFEFKNVLTNILIANFCSYQITVVCYIQYQSVWLSFVRLQDNSSKKLSILRNLNQQNKAIKFDYSPSL